MTRGIGFLSIMTDVKRENGTDVMLGDRVFNDGDYGTIMYIGLVKGTKGLWLGVDWDRSERGKHDGTYNGIQYFTTIGPSSGSFIRPNRVEFGMTFLSALRDRYGRSMDDSGGIDKDAMFILGDNQQHTTIEVVGAVRVNERQSHLEQLLDVGVRDTYIYSAGPIDEIHLHCPNIRELDISKCLLGSWAEVARITEQLPHLSKLNVSDSRLAIPAAPSDLSHAFSQLTCLSVNRIGITWNQLVLCSTMWPALHELHACYNPMSKLSNPGPYLSRTLHMLNLTGCAISDWTEMLKLSTIVNLQTLLLNDNGIHKILFDDVTAGNKSSAFQKLKSFSIKNNHLNEWTSINELNKLAMLEELSLYGNPILEMDRPLTVRQIIIAKIENMQYLNRTQVSGERKGAEFDYLRLFGREWQKSGGNQNEAENKPSDAFMENHPRYTDLVTKYGAPEDSELEVKGHAIKDTLILVKITSTLMPQKGVVEKKLPGTMSVQKLRTLIQRLFHVNDTIQLSYVSDKMPGPEIDMDNDLRQLSFYSIENGDTIKVTW